MGATLALASAAVIAISALALPVYEIYKAGQDLHWQPGLDLFGAYGLKLVFVPHWNNAEGGAELDTSRCFMGRSRFEELLALLPPDATVVGIDEHTALAADLDTGTAEVMGAGDVTVLRRGDPLCFSPGGRFSLSEFGPFRWPEPDAGLPAGSGPRRWPRTRIMSRRRKRRPTCWRWLSSGKSARAQRDWAQADSLAPTGRCAGLADSRYTGGSCGRITAVRVKR